MPTLLPVGGSTTLTQSATYALPAKQVKIQASAALELSLDGSNWTLTAATTTGTDVTAVFARCTTAAAIVVCKGV